MTTDLTDAEKNRLQYYREKIAGTDYARLTAAEVADIKERRVQSEASAAIEGLYGTPMDDRISDLFEELAVPESLRLEILNDFTSWSLREAEHLAAE